MATVGQASREARVVVDVGDSGGDLVRDVNGGGGFGGFVGFEVTELSSVPRDSSVSSVSEEDGDGSDCPLPSPSRL